MKNSDTVVLSIAYMPPINYFVEMLRHGKCILEKNENYCKQTYRNRCEIYGANGKQILCIPVKKTHDKKTKISDVCIDNKVQWQKNHWRSIVSAYNSSPFFLYYSDIFEFFYNKQFENLFVYNLSILKAILEILELKIEITESEYFIKEYSENYVDLRYKFHPKIKAENLKKEYNQVFIEKYGFINNLSIIDLIFNVGPDSSQFLYGLL